MAKEGIYGSKGRDGSLQTLERGLGGIWLGPLESLILFGKLCSDIPGGPGKWRPRREVVPDRPLEKEALNNLGIAISFI